MFGSQVNAYRPSQLYHKAQDGYSCELLAPHDALTSSIYYYWVLRIEDREVSLAVIPDGAVDLVLSPEIADFAALYTPKPERFEIPLNGPIEYVGVCFHADKVSTFFSHSLQSLSELEAGIGVVEALGLEALVARIQNTHVAASIAETFDAFFRDYLPCSNAQRGAHLLGDIFELLEAGNVAFMAEKIGLSERQLRRVTRELVGLSPKQIQRVVRLQRVFQTLVESDRQLLSDGYYDDSHMIRELKKLTGMTPGAICRMAEKYNQYQR